MNYDILFLLITIQFFMYVYIFFFLSSKIDWFNETPLNTIARRYVVVRTRIQLFHF